MDGAVNTSRSRSALILAVLFVAVVKITAYSNDYQSTGKYPSDPAYGITASGTRARAGTCASKTLPFGTEVEIMGLGTYTVEDRGGGLEKDQIDVWFPRHKDAKNFGVQYREVKIIKRGTYGKTI